MTKLSEMPYFKKLNLIVGWAVFAVAAVVYGMTIEPTASLWDCSEFIATSYKLEVGHPPGAPLFMMISRLFMMVAPSPGSAAAMANMMSAMASAFTILFLFWSITHLARKIYAPQGGTMSRAHTWSVLGAGIIGALAYTFTDTFWFSAVEGEVYALSSMFTALVFWAILKWENVADQPGSNRWLVLIAYFMGLSIGIHILNLLTIPALVFVYYFRKYPEVTKWGVVKATLASGAILLVINGFIIPYSVAIAAWFDRMFVNAMGLPINSGLTFFVLALFALLGWAVWFTHKRGKVLANTILLCVTVIMLGYSSYASVVIRASVNPPMNSNNPNHAYALLYLLNRDQYGDHSLIKGPAYSSPAIALKEKTKYYVGDDGKYHEMTTANSLEYPSEFEFFFSRMHSGSKDPQGEEYRSWVANFQGRKIPFNGEMITVPTFGDNVKFFLNYQLNFMYWRYFLWNFVGRQSDNQSTGQITDGNWLSGIKFIDAMFLGPQDNLPSEMATNKGRNTYYVLPFILGLVGLIYQLNRDKKNFTVVMWLFIMMGIALVVYFNTTPGEPRERDYVYAGSFYAFCIWIGFGVMALADALGRLLKKPSVVAALFATAVCSAVPLLLAAQNWDDHDRSHRYVARDIGFNYLSSCLPNAIIMNYADNDTFPIWYNQEVEGYRTDVRVMNMSYLGADWYVDEMRIKVNESEAVPFTLPRSKYINRNDYIYIQDHFEGQAVDIRQVMDFVRSDDPRTMVSSGSRTNVDFIPAKRFALPVNKANAVASGIVKEKDLHLVPDTIYFTINKSTLDKGELMLLDLLSNFDWKRPLCFTHHFTLAPFGLREYLQYDGFAYRLVPIRTPHLSSIDVGRIDTDDLYQKLVNEFRYGNVKDPRVDADYFVQYNFSSNQTRTAFGRLAKKLAVEGDTVRAREVLARCVEEIPFNQIRHNYVLTVPVIEGYYAAGQPDKANAVLEDWQRILEEYVVYFNQFTGEKRMAVASALKENMQYLGELYRLAANNGQPAVAARIEEFLRDNASPQDMM